MEYFGPPAAVTITLETIIKQYLSGDQEVPFQSAFLAFRDILAHSACQPPRPPIRNAATATPVFSGKNTPLPKSVSVVSRVVDISESRRHGMVHVLWKLVSTGFCQSERELVELWKAKDPREAGHRFLGVAVWAVQTEKEIFDKSKRNLSEYQSLLLNVVFGLLRKKDWRGKEVPQSHLTNSAAQTQDSFIQQRQRSAKEILNHKRQKNLTKREFDVLREQNELLERKARRRRRLELRHSCTQTSASLRDGLKSLESESSGGFSWLDLAPSPLRFFPMLWVATQTDDRQIRNTKKIVVNGKIKLMMRPKGMKNPLDPVLDFVIHNFDTRIGIAPQFGDGMAPSTETALGLRVAHFVQLLLKTPNLKLGRCPNHQAGSGLKTGCQTCTAAIKAPPPWADVMFHLLYEIFTGSLMHNPTDGVHFLYLSKRGIEKDDPFLGAQSPWSLLVHLLRQLILNCGRQFDHKGELVDPKEVRTETMDCGCFVLRMVEKLIEPDSQFGITEKMCIILSKVLTTRIHPSHMCLRCGKLESQFMGKFRVCCECRRQRLMVKALYCSLDCLLKDWHKHHKLHDALSPGKIPSVGCAVMLFTSMQTHAP